MKPGQTPNMSRANAERMSRSAGRRAAKAEGLRMVSYSYSNSPELQTVAIDFNLLQPGDDDRNCFRRLQTVAVCYQTRFVRRLKPTRTYDSRASLNRGVRTEDL